MNQPLSAYFIPEGQTPEIRTTLAVIVDNEPGVLARVVGLFSARGYNIESLTVAETDHDRHTSRITIVTKGTPQVKLDDFIELMRPLGLVEVSRTGVAAIRRGREAL